MQATGQTGIRASERAGSRHGAAIEAGPHIARMLDMDSGSDSDYTDDKLLIIDNDSDTDSERPIIE